MHFACDAPLGSHYNLSSDDVRGLVYVSEVHWAGSVLADGTRHDADDDFIEIRNGHVGPVDIGRWNVQLSSGCELLITIPPGTVLGAGVRYAIGRHTNGAFPLLELVVPELALPPAPFVIRVRDGGGRTADTADFLGRSWMPAGVALPTVRRSMMRRIEFFGAEPGNNPDNWKSYEAPAGSDRIAPAYRSSVFASPGGFVSGEVKF